MTDGFEKLLDWAEVVDKLKAGDTANKTRTVIDTSLYGRLIFKKHSPSR